MAKNRIFFPQAALDQWISDGRVELGDGELLIKSEQRKYRVIEAVRVLAEVTGSEDVFGLVGRVKTRNFVVELGAELLNTSMIIGDNAYDVVPGFMGAPIGSFAQYRSLSPGAGGPPGLDAPKSEEELLAQFLIAKLD